MFHFKKYVGGSDTEEVADDEPDEKENDIGERERHSENYTTETDAPVERGDVADQADRQQIGDGEDEEEIIGKGLGKASVEHGMSGSRYTASGTLPPRQGFDYTFGHPLALNRIKPPDERQRHCYQRKKDRQKYTATVGGTGVIVHHTTGSFPFDTR